MTRCPWWPSCDREDLQFPGGPRVRIGRESLEDRLARQHGGRVPDGYDVALRVRRDQARLWRTDARGAEHYREMGLCALSDVCHKEAMHGYGDPRETCVIADDCHETINPDGSPRTVERGRRP